MNETMIIRQYKKEEEIEFLIDLGAEKPLIIDFDDVQKLKYGLHVLIESRRKASKEERIVAVKYKECYLALTIGLEGIYLLGINPLKPADLGNARFKAVYRFVNQEIRYDGTDVDITAQTLLNAFAYLTKHYTDAELDCKILKLLIFFVCEAARFETAWISVLNALLEEKPEANPISKWKNHVDILHNWGTLQDYVYTKKHKDYNTQVTVKYMIDFISENETSPVAHKIKDALIKMRFISSRCMESENSYIYLNDYKFEHLNTVNMPDTIVGSGYDVINGDYISMQGAKVANPIVDMEKPVKFISQNYIKSDVMKAEGSTLKETMMHFNAKLKADTSFYIFSGCAEAEFDTTSENQNNYSYFRFYSKFINKREYLNGDTYKRYLTEEFKNDIDNMVDIDLLFSKYGTHMIKEILVGGRLAFSFSYHKESGEDQQTISARVNAAFGEYLKVHSTADYSTNAKYVASKSNICVSTFGGEHCELHTLELFARNYPKWVESLKQSSYWSPCDIVDMTNMVPIWHLCTDNKRSVEIEQRYYELLYQRTKKLYPTIQYLNMETFVTRGKTDFEARKNCPMKYNMVYKNIHKGVDNSFSYLCYMPLPIVGVSINIVGVFVFHADVPTIKNLVPVMFENVIYKCTSLGHFHQFTENGKKYYTHLLVAAYKDNYELAIQVMDIDILYGDSQLPKGWNYATSASVPDMPENCNKGYDVEASYIIYKRKFFNNEFKL